MIRFIHDSWEGVMNMDKNPLRHIPDLQVRHLAIQLLAWMWCICFSLYFGSFVVFGFTAVAHIILIIAIVVTVAVFKNEEKENTIIMMVHLNMKKLQENMRTYGNGKRYVSQS